MRAGEVGNAEITTNVLDDVDDRTVSDFVVKVRVV
jgi:hypothetical protein